jgi:outer membrane protein TolC
MTVRPTILALVFSMSASAAFAQQSETPSARRITLPEAIAMALARNHAIRLAQLSVDEKDSAQEAAKSGYFPQVRNETTLVHLSDTQLVVIPAGGLGVVGVTPVPSQTIILIQGGVSAVTNGTGIVQPLTQLFKVRAANDVARAEADAARGKAHAVEDDTALRVHQVYYRILITDVRRRAVLAKIQASEFLQRERIQQVRYGSALEADVIDSRTHALQARQELLTTELHRSDLQMQLNDVTGLPLTTPLLLNPRVPPVTGPSGRCEREVAFARRWTRILKSQRPGRKWKEQPRRSVSPSTSSCLKWKRSHATAFRTTCRFLRGASVQSVFGRVTTCSMAAESAVVRDRETQLVQANENLARISDAVALRLQTA